MSLISKPEQDPAGIHLAVERAIGQLVDEFTQDPFHFFTEADALARFQQILEGYPWAKQIGGVERGDKTAVGTGELAQLCYCGRVFHRRVYD